MSGGGVLVKNGMEMSDEAEGPPWEDMKAQALRRSGQASGASSIERDEA